MDYTLGADIAIQDTAQDEVKGIEKPEKKIDEKELNEKITKRYKKFQPLREKIHKEYEENDKYYMGTYQDEGELFEGEDNFNVNKIFQNTEIVVSMGASKVPEPDVDFTPITRQGRQRSIQISEELKRGWERKLQMQTRMEGAIRTRLKQKYVAFKYFWNNHKNQYDGYFVKEGKLLFPENCGNPYDAFAIIEEIETTLGKLIEKFPEAEEKIRECNKKDITLLGDDTDICYLQYWENDIVAYQFEDKLIGHDPNPNWNHDEADKELNHFECKKKAYIFFNVLKEEHSLVDRTSEIEQSKGLQRNIDKRKRHIDRNVKLSNGQIVTAGGVLDAENSQKIAQNYDGNNVINIPGVQSVGDAITILTSRPIDQTVIADMRHSEEHIDNIFGTHGASRGERASGEPGIVTAQLKASDESRNAPTHKAVERFAKEWFDSYLQLMTVFWTDEQRIVLQEEDKKTLSPKNRETFLSREDLRGIKFEINVKAGSTIPEDKANEKQEAWLEVTAGIRSKLDYHRAMGRSNADQLARNAHWELTDPSKLYDRQDGEDVLSLRHIFAIINDKPVEILDVPDKMQMEKHVQTMWDYIKGEEVHEDLTGDLAYDMLDLEKKMIMDEHFQAERGILEDLERQERLDLIKQKRMQEDPEFARQEQLKEVLMSKLARNGSAGAVEGNDQIPSPTVSDEEMPVEEMM